MVYSFIIISFIHKFWFCFLRIFFERRKKIKTVKRGKGLFPNVTLYISFCFSFSYYIIYILSLLLLLLLHSCFIYIHKYITCFIYLSIYMYTVFLFVCFICYVIVGLLVGGGGGGWSDNRRRE